MQDWDSASLLSATKFYPRTSFLFSLVESIQTHDVPFECDIMIVGVCSSYDIQESRKKDMTSEISIGNLLFVILELRSMLESDVF